MAVVNIDLQKKCFGYVNHMGSDLRYAEISRDKILTKRKFSKIEKKKTYLDVDIFAAYKSEIHEIGRQRYFIMIRYNISG